MPNVPYENALFWKKYTKWGPGDPRLNYNDEALHRDPGAAEVHPRLRLWVYLRGPPSTRVNEGGASALVASQNYEVPGNFLYSCKIVPIW